MLLFVLWATLAIGTLVGAGYSHYRYRVRNNQYYAHLFAKDGDKLPSGKNPPEPRSYALAAMTLIMVCLLVPMSILI